MKNEMRNFIDKIKVFNGKGNSKIKLNEDTFSCNINDLYNAVLKHANSLGYYKDNIKVEKFKDYVLVTLRYNITTDYSWHNLNETNTVNKVKSKKDNFQNQFSSFTEFCDSGVRGFVGTFKKGVKMININSVAYLYQEKLILHDKHVMKYTENNIEDLGKTTDYVNRYGANEINFLTIQVGIFLRDI